MFIESDNEAVSSTCSNSIEWEKNKEEFIIQPIQIPLEDEVIGIETEASYHGKETIKEITQILNTSQTIPKLFTKNYSEYISEAEKLLQSDKIEKQKISRVRYNNFPISEKLFLYLKDGLEKGKTTYDERYNKIKNSIFKRILKNPLLLIFNDPAFERAEKSPKLYFDTYKAVLYGKSFDLNGFVQLVNKTKVYHYHIPEIEQIMLSQNLEKNDLLYVYLNLDPDGSFHAMKGLKNKFNPLFDLLFLSDLNSHFFDSILELKNQESYIFIDQLIKTQKTSVKYYISDIKLKNGVNALAWFKAYMYYINEKLPKNYIEEESLGKLKIFRQLKKEFISHDIFAPEILAMFPSIKDNQNPKNLSQEAHSLINGLDQKTSTKVASLKSRFQYSKNTISLETALNYMMNKVTECTPQFFDKLESHKPTSFELGQPIFPKRKFQASKQNTCSKHQSESVEYEKRQKTSRKTSLTFLNLSRENLQPNLNPVLESEPLTELQVANKGGDLKHEDNIFSPILGVCKDLMNNTAVSINIFYSTENQCLIQREVVVDPILDVSFDLRPLTEEEIDSMVNPITASDSNKNFSIF